MSNHLAHLGQPGQHLEVVIRLLGQLVSKSDRLQRRQPNKRSISGHHTADQLGSATANGPISSNWLVEAIGCGSTGCRLPNPNHQHQKSVQHGLVEKFTALSRRLSFSYHSVFLTNPVFHSVFNTLPTQTSGVITKIFSHQHGIVQNGSIERIAALTVINL